MGREFAGRTAVVTGAASGIGRAVASALACAGATVVGGDRDVLGLESSPAGAFVDVASPASVEAFRDGVLGRLGHVDVVVNAAGWDHVEPFLDNDEDFWRDVVDINYLGMVRVCQAFLRPMADAGRGGRIVNVASDAGRVGSTGEAVYAGAKGGVIAFTKSLAREAARYGVAVNCVSPGPTDTPLFAAQPASIRQALVRATPLGRTATPAEVADAVLFLASDRASFITGQILSVSGGLTMSG